MTPWQWWAASVPGHDEGEWELGEFDSRDEAIAAANKEFGIGEPFYVIEARSSTAAKYGSGNFEIVPFVRTRNKERLIAGPRAVAA